MIIVGFLALSAVLKFCGYPDAVFVRWNPLAVFLRENVGWFLLIPIAWVFCVTWAERAAPDGISHAVAYAVGVYLPIIMIALFLYPAIYPYTRPIIFGNTKRSAANKLHHSTSWAVGGAPKHDVSGAQPTGVLNR
jgi:hypothetical protein